MRITQLSLAEVACFERIDLAFPPGNDPRKADVHLLVGQNGTGKSTLLRALAQFFDREPTGLRRRMWGPESAAALGVPGGQLKLRAVVAANLSPSNPWTSWGELALGASDRKLSDEHLRGRTDFAAFAYSGLRTVESFELRSIQEVSGAPLRGACSFDGGTSTGDLIQWIATTRAKEAFALQRGDAVAAAARRDAIGRLESALGLFAGEPVRFWLEDEPLSVRVEFRGARVAPDLLPDGLRSVFSWLGDLLMRMDRVQWTPETPVLERSFALFLDEIEVHLHPVWQRRVLPMLQGLFPQAQIFVATHSPFVVSSADDAWIHVLKVDERGRGRLHDTLPSQIGQSYDTVLREVFGVAEQFDDDTERRLAEFYRVRDSVLRGEIALGDLESSGGPLAQRSAELSSIVGHELAMVRRRLSRSVAAS